jgi:hypothetical protein
VIFHDDPGDEPSSNAVYLAPPATVEPFPFTLDVASALALAGAKSAREAAERAITLPAEGLDPKEVCRALSRGRTPAGLGALAAPGARVLEFPEPYFPVFRAKVKPLVPSPELAASVGLSCRDLVCPPNRPACFRWATDSPDGQAYWMVRRGRDLKLEGIAVYVGS